MGPGLSVLLHPHVAGGDADHPAAFVIEHLGSGEARIDLDAERLGLLRQPAADVAQRHGIGAVIAHQRRHQHVRQADAECVEQEEEPVVGDRRLERVVRIVAPVGQKSRDAGGIDHSAGENVGADLRAFSPAPAPKTSCPLTAACCLMRMAAASPAGPAPTITTSNSMDSRSGSSVVMSVSLFG